jgi:hypothetical protein
VHEKYRDALSRGVGGHEVDQTGLPPYVIPGTPEEDHWRQAHPSGQVRKHIGRMISWLARSYGWLLPFCNEEIEAEVIYNWINRSPPRSSGRRH